MITDTTDESCVTTLAILTSDLEEMLASHAGNDTLERALRRISNGEDLLRMLSAYVYFNSVFGSCVANLAGEIGARQDLFKDPDEPVEFVADRSVEVAALIFFAAIDEFGGSSKSRCTHRSMAQATLKGTGSFFCYKTATINKLTRPNAETLFAIDRVRDGYALNQSVDEEKLFRAIGFHIGSEVLADQEFHILDQFLRARFEDLVHYLETVKITINEVPVPAYCWIQIHTIVEAAHFNAGLSAANLALQLYAGTESQTQIREWIIVGFKEFMSVQLQFLNGLMD